MPAAFFRKMRSASPQGWDAVLFLFAERRAVLSTMLPFGCEGCEPTTSRANEVGVRLALFNL